jgi:hypothetical protein
LASFLATQIILSTLLPYIIPFACLVYPLYRMTSTLAELENEQIRVSVKTILTIVWTHIALR